MPLRETLLSLSPLAYWPGDDGSGSTVSDVAGSARNLTGFSGTWGTSRLLAGTAEGSFYSSAGDGSIASASWNQITGAFSIAFVTNWTAVSNDSQLGKGVGTNGYVLQRRDSGLTDTIRLGTYSGSVASLLDATVNTILRDNPHVTMIVGTYDGVNGRIYVDGALVAGPTALNAPGSGTGALATDASQASSDFALWDRALAASEISALWTAANTPPAVDAHYSHVEVLPGSTALVNASIISRDGLDDVRAADEESVAVYGHRAVSVDVALSSDSDAEELAAFHANRRSVPTQVVSRIDAVLGRESAEVLEALAALDLGTLVTLARTTHDGRPLAFSATVESMDWDLRPGRQSLSLSTAPSDTYGLYGSASWFVIGESLLGGTAVLAPY